MGAPEDVVTTGSVKDVDAILDSFLSTGTSREVSRALWTLRPMIAQAYLNPSRLASGPKSAGAVARRRARATAAAVRRVGRVLVAEVDGAVFLTETINERRALAPLMGESPTTFAATAFRTNRMHVLERPPDSKRIGELADEIDASVGMPTNPAALFVDRASFKHAVAVGNRSYQAAVAFLRKTQPSALVVATQQNVLVRAAIAAAHELGIPTVYFPHAPVATVPWYEDLPTHYAGLRGEGEASFYADLGVEAGLVDTVGVPGGRDVAPPVLDADKPTAVALSPIAPDLLKQFIDVVARGVTDAVVAPHPRQSPTLVKRMIPSSWTLSNRETTMELLQTGLPRVVLHNSGVAWESLRIGVPTIHVDLEGSPHSYVMFDDDAIVKVDTADDLRDVCAWPTPSKEQRASLIAAAEYWGGPVGDDSVALAHDLIARAQSEGPRSSVIRDLWAADG